MTRDIDALTDAALQLGHVPALMLVELDFPDGMFRMNNSGQDFDWNGDTFYAGGTLLGISDVQESASLEAHGITLQLNAISLAPISGSPDHANIVQLARGQNYQGRDARVWLAPLDPDAYTPITDPVLAFAGRMNKMDFHVGRDATFSLACESRLADWNRPRMRRYNDADQRARFPTDRGLEYMEANVEKNLVWGYPLPASTGTATTPGGVGANNGQSHGIGNLVDPTPQTPGQSHGIGALAPTTYIGPPRNSR